MKERRLDGKIAVVTGASRGIGLAIAQRLAVAGCDLALCARNERAIPQQDIADRNGVRVLAHECDVRDEGSVEAFFQSVRERYTRIDFLINNAGTAAVTANVSELAAADWRDVIDTNLTGMFLCTRLALPVLKDGGTIVNNLSIGAKVAFPGQAAYIASKHGARGLTEVLRQELRPRGIRVIALVPGATDTDIWNIFWENAPRKRMMEPETVAEAVVHALTLPQNATVEELVIGPTAGEL